MSGESIFPFMDIQKTLELKTLGPPPKEYAWDFEKNEFRLENGRLKIVEGAEAVKVWIYKLLKTPRYRYLIYSWNYGHELERLIGSGYSSGIVQNEVKRLLEDALLINASIKRTENVEVVFQGDKLNISFTAVTDFGEVNISV